MTPLSDWLNMLPRGRGRGRGIAGYHYHPKVCYVRMLYCNRLKSYGKMCMQRAHYVRDLHKTILFTCKVCMSFVTCLLNIGVPC